MHSKRPLDVVDLVLSWGLPDEAIADAVMAQASWRNADDSWVLE